MVFSPNWALDSPAQMQRLNEFLTRTGPTLYFVPLTQIATILAWVLLALNRVPEARRDYRLAALFALLATAVNVLVVTTVVPVIFGPDYLAHADELAEYCARWNALNLARLTFTGIAVAFCFSAFRQLDRLAASRG